MLGGATAPLPKPNPLSTPVLRAPPRIARGLSRSPQCLLAVDANVPVIIRYINIYRAELSTGYILPSRSNLHF